MSKSTRPAIQLPLPIEGQTIEIPLTKGYIAIIDAIDADLAGFNWSTVIKKQGGYTYAIRRIGGRKDGTRVYLHKLILERTIGRPLIHHEWVDHKNGSTLDNRRSNLRIATPRQNIRNSKKRKDNTSGYKGVSRASRSKKWLATIAINGKTHSLGLFDTPEEAHDAYCKTAKELHGEFFNPG